MDASQFDALARTVSTGADRRGLLRWFGGAALGVSFLHQTRSAEAKKKKRKKKLKKNQFGCVNVGGKCRGKSANCCSGICEGKKPKKGKKDKSRCVAHDESTCQPGQDSCNGDVTNCTTTAGDPGLCVLTTGNAAYCTATIGAVCTPCNKDADCQGICGPEAACVVCDVCPDQGTVCFGVNQAPCG